jgi:SsrA-binding protein
MAKKKRQDPSTLIAKNRRASFEYSFEDTIEAGIELQGWEVKSLRAGKGQLTDSYVDFDKGEAYLLNSHIQPLNAASTHVVNEPVRRRKLLLNRKEINRLAGAVQQKGYTCLVTRLYWKGHLVKAQVALAKGKQLHDKRASEKSKDWAREKARVLKDAN